jgi:hypothetical protein
MERFLRGNFFTDEERNAKLGKRVRTMNIKEWRELPPGTAGKVIHSKNYLAGIVINTTEAYYIEIEFYNLPWRRKPTVYVFNKQDYEQ